MPENTDFTYFATEHPNYFAGQYLLKDDFELQHKYLSDRQRYYNQNLHVSGIIEGLEVEVIQGEKAVLIKSGSAIDSSGNLIVFKDKAGTRFSDFNNITEGEIYIQYFEEKQVQQQEGVADSYTRWRENPKLEFGSTTPANSIKIAKLVISGDNITLDANVREYSGLSLPNSNSQALTIRSGGNANPNLAVLSGSLKIDDNLTVTGTISGKIDTGNITSGTLNVDRIPNLSADKITSGTLSVARIPNLSADKITTGTVTGNLTVNGSLTVNTGGASGGAGLWNKLVVTTTSEWGDGNTQYVTIGAGGAAGIMLSNPHVTWRDKKASIRYGRSGGIQKGSYWDAGVREDGSFSFSLNGVGDHKLTIDANGNLSTKGSLTVNTGGAGLWNKLVVTTTSEWGDGNIQYVTIGAGGAAGIMLSNPHVTWRDKRASIRYGRSEGKSTGSYWDAGVREDGSFSFSLNGVNSHKLTIATNGNLTVGGALKIGELFATRGTNNLRMIRGLISPNGTTYSGEGFSSRKVETGIYDITFTPAFSDHPAVIATQDYPGNINNTGGNTLDNAVVVGISRQKCRIKCGNNKGNPSDRYFSFLCIGL